MEILESINAKNGQTLFLNPNKTVVQSIKKLIERNEGHCPCNNALTEETICPCKEARENGNCRCGLYLNFLLENA